jgi:hypothetical protein
LDASLHLIGIDLTHLVTKQRLRELSENDWTLAMEHQVLSWRHVRSGASQGRRARSKATWQRQVGAPRVRSSLDRWRMTADRWD